MTIKDFLNESYDNVSYRVTLPGWDDKFLANEDEVYAHSTFAGVFEILDGKIVSLDGDSYSEEEEVIWFEKWTNEKKNVYNGLTILIKTDWFGA